MSGSIFITVAMIIIGGLLAAASLIASKNKEAGEMIKKLAPYQSWVGIVLFVWGVWNLIKMIQYLGIMTRLMAIAPILIISTWVAVVVMIVLGLILSLNFMKSRKEIPAEKVEALEKKLKPIQVPVGIIAIIDGIVLLLARFMRF